MTTCYTTRMTGYSGSDMRGGMSHVSDGMRITLPPEIEGAVDGAVRSGEYASRSAVIEEALRDWRDKRTAKRDLKADVEAGIADIEAGRVRDFDAERIIRKGRQRLSQR